jgi:hypothetical protein
MPAIGVKRAIPARAIENAIGTERDASTWLLAVNLPGDDCRSPRMVQFSFGWPATPWSIACSAVISYSSRAAMSCT